MVTAMAKAMAMATVTASAMVMAMVMAMRTMLPIFLTFVNLISGFISLVSNS